MGRHFFVSLLLGTLLACGGMEYDVEFDDNQLSQNLCTATAGGGGTIGSYYGEAGESDNYWDPFVAGCVWQYGGSPQYNDAASLGNRNEIKEYMKVMTGESLWTIYYGYYLCSCGREQVWVPACNAYAYRCKS